MTKKIEKCGAQGDVMFVRIDRIPGDAKPVPAPKDGRIVVAHSETGHHHYLAAIGVEMFQPADPMICYLRVSAELADVVHARPFDTHETIALGKGDWQIRRQREYTPEGWRQVQD